MRKLWLWIVCSIAMFAATVGGAIWFYRRWFLRVRRNSHGHPSV
jgi:hypothetical protein